MLEVSAVELADRFGTGLHIHVAEDALDLRMSKMVYDAGPIERLERHGLVDDRTLAVHCIHLGSGAVTLGVLIGTLSLVAGARVATVTLVMVMVWPSGAPLGLLVMEWGIISPSTSLYSLSVVSNSISWPWASPAITDGMPASAISRSASSDSEPRRTRVVI